MFPVRCIDYGKHECELKFLLKTKGDYDILMMQDIGKAIAYIEEAGISGMTIVGPYGHNGVNPKYFETVFGLFNSVTRGPYNSEITLYDEGLAVC